MACGNHGVIDFPVRSANVARGAHLGSNRQAFGNCHAELARPSFWAIKLPRGQVMHVAPFFCCTMARLATDAFFKVDLSRALGRWCTVARHAVLISRIVDNRSVAHNPQEIEDLAASVRVE
jgi:hypothetical protein